MKEIIRIEQKKLQLITLIAQTYDYELLVELEKMLLENDREWWNPELAQEGEELQDVKDHFAENLQRRQSDKYTESN